MLATRDDTPGAGVRLTLAAAAVSVAAVVTCLGAILPLGPGLLLFAIVVWFTLPGVWLARLAYAPQAGARIAAWLVGPVWGYGLSSVVLLAMWVAGARGIALLTAPIFALGAVALIAPHVRDLLTPPAFDRRDIVAALLLLLLVPAVVGRPFARVGEDLPDGRAYRAYFTADFIWRMAVAAELAKGSVPPRNPFYRGDQLRYYWLAHLLPAAEYRELQKSVRLDQVLLVNSVALDLAFVLFLYGFVRHWVGHRAAAAAGCVGAVLFTSFEGVERLWFLWRIGETFERVRFLNIDAISRWIYSSLPIDGLHRLLMYQPHHSTGYALGLSAVLVYAQARVPERTSLAAFAGSLLAGCLLLSTFSAIMLTAMTAVVGVGVLTARRAWRGLAVAAVVGAIPLAIATWLAMSLHYVDKAGSLIRILVNPQAVTNPWTAIFLSFGPMLLLGAIGIAYAIWRREWRLWVIGVIVVVSFVFYFFVDVRDHQYVYVGWRAGHMLFVAFAVLVGFAIQEMMRGGRALRVATVMVVVVLAALATPTLAIDLYNTQDLNNREEAAGFKWTLVLAPDELEALSWIRRYTQPDDLIQVEPFTRDSYTWAYVPAFAERRMSAGLPISMVPLDKYIAASERVRDVYRTAQPDEAHRKARRLGIDYLIIGAPERTAHPGFEAAASSRPDLFRPVFRKGEVAIYFVEHGFK